MRIGTSRRTNRTNAKEKKRKREREEIKSTERVSNSIRTLTLFMIAFRFFPFAQKFLCFAAHTAHRIAFGLLIQDAFFFSFIFIFLLRCLVFFLLLFVLLIRISLSTEFTRNTHFLTERRRKKICCLCNVLNSFSQK